MDTISIIGAAQSLFILIILFVRKREAFTVCNYLLGLWILVMGLRLFMDYIHSLGLNFHAAELIFINSILLFFEAPLIYLYTKAVKNKKGALNRGYLLHFIPFFIALLGIIFSYYVKSEAERIGLFTFESIKNNFILDVIVNKVQYYVLIYPIWSLIILLGHSKEVKSNYSYTEHIDLKWLLGISVGLAVLYTLNLSPMFKLYFLISQEFTFFMMIFIQLVKTTFVFIMGYYGINQKIVVNQIELENEEVDYNNQIEKYRKSGLKENDALVYLGKLLELMQNERLYLNPELSITDLADKLNISTNILSQIINERMGYNFYEFINRYRVQEVERRLGQKDNEKYTLISIAFESGFNSKSNFNRLFKKYTGKSPSDFIVAVA